MALFNRYTELNTCLNDYTSWYQVQQQMLVNVPSCVKFLKLAVDGRLYLLHMFKDVLMSLRQSYTNTSDLDQALDQFTRWYATNESTITDIVPLLQFLKKATDDSLHILHLMRMELAESQNKKAEDTLLYLPVGFR